MICDFWEAPWEGFTVEWLQSENGQFYRREGQNEDKAASGKEAAGTHLSWVEGKVVASCGWHMDLVFVCA